MAGVSSFNVEDFSTGHPPNHARYHSWTVPLFLTFPTGLKLEALGPLAHVEPVLRPDLHDVDAVRLQVGDVHLIVDADVRLRE